MSKDTFTRYVGNFGNWSWVVLFAKQKIDHVLDAYCDIVGEQAGDAIPVVTGTHTHNPSGTVVQLANSEWTMVLHRVGVWEDFDASDFSRRLNARVVLFHAEDTSGATGCSSISPDGTITKIQTQDDLENEQELYDCMEEYEEEMGVEVSPPEPGTIVDDYDSYLTDQGIPLVCISLDASRSTAIVEAGDETMVDRVVLVGNPCDE